MPDRKVRSGDLQIGRSSIAEILHAQRDFKIAREGRGKLRVSRIVRGFILDLIPPIFRKSVRAIKRAIKGEKLTELWN